MRIAYLDPVDETGAFEEIVLELRKYADKETKIDFKYLEKGAGDLEYICYEAFTVPEIIRTAKTLKDESYDAIIIGCFYDPGIDAVRECLDDIVVVGPGESSILLSRYLGSRFSIIAGRDKHLPRMREMVERTGLSGNLASIRTLGIRVNDMQKDHDFLFKRMTEEISEAINKDKSEVILLGCTMEAGQFQKLQGMFGVPVIDPTVAALKAAEYLVQCKKMCGWTVSRAFSYEMPDLAEMKAHNIFNGLL